MSERSDSKPEPQPTPEETVGWWARQALLDRAVEQAERARRGAA